MSNDPQREPPLHSSHHHGGTTLAGLIAVTHPALIPALGIAFTAFMALVLFLKL
ncbi:hypothetical protein P1P75_39950 [Streptomyces sp. ID05-39B]|uniref:hypothetical protein n=1 Tax=Streptomyces sp. ID05-39B TaxID=3028664 RepID=UPI0029AB1602|nr:hypothetical protein [Streptomyces sp. ID05-39B]MDX3532406.1 hypothetical protein [Streptomyces sp. ID05-39B]